MRRNIVMNDDWVVGSGEDIWDGWIWRRMRYMWSKYRNQISTNDTFDHDQRIWLKIMVCSHLTALVTFEESKISRDQWSKYFIKWKRNKDKFGRDQQNKDEFIWKYCVNRNGPNDKSRFISLPTRREMEKLMHELSDGTCHLTAGFKSFFQVGKLGLRRVKYHVGI